MERPLDPAVHQASHDGADEEIGKEGGLDCE